MTTFTRVNVWEEEIERNIANNFSESSLTFLRHQFKRDGFLKVPQIMPLNIRQEMKQEALRLLELHSERRDLKLATTGNTPRNMSVVTSENIAESSEFINTIYRSEGLKNILERLAGEPFLPCPSKDEEF